MNSKILIIYEYQILFEILNEIREKLNFKVIKLNSKEFIDYKYEKKNNYLILSSRKYENIGDCLILSSIPIKLERLIEFININFLKNKFSDQSNVKIGKYNLDLNSRKISLKGKNLNLTEREINLIVFINEKKSVTVKDLQEKVWDYSPDLETHTVETHIYRLRKKMKETFGDENFITNDTNGYLIK